MKKNDKLFLMIAAVVAVILVCFALVKGCENVTTCYEMRDDKMSLVRGVREGLYRDGDYKCIEKDKGIYDYMVESDRLIKVTWYNDSRTEVKYTEYFSVYY